MQNNSEILNEGTEKFEKAIKLQARVEDIPKGESTKGKPRAGIRRMDWCWSADLKDEQTNVW